MDLADREGFEVELQGGVLNIFFEEPTETRFVVSPNAPVRQIWVSALVRSYKLSWSAERGVFELDGEPLARPHRAPHPRPPRAVDRPNEVPGPFSRVAGW